MAGVRTLGILPSGSRPIGDTRLFKYLEDSTNIWVSTHMSIWQPVRSYCIVGASNKGPAMANTQAPHLRDRGQKPEVMHRAKDPNTSVESLQKLLGSIPLTMHVPFTRLFDNDDERLTDRACH